MNEALRRDARGFIARQTVATQDLRKTIYVGPYGKGFHKVRNPHSDEEYIVADGIGGATLTPGMPAIVASFSGQHGEVLISRPPAGMGGSAVTKVTLPPESSPSSGDVGEVLLDGNYRGWSFYCDGGSYVWLACYHSRMRYQDGPVFVDGTQELVVSKLAVSSIVGQTDLASDGYDIGEFTDGVGGTEVFRYGLAEMTSFDDPKRFTVSLVSGGGVVFVVSVDINSPGDYSVLCLTDSGEFIGSDTFTGRSASEVGPVSNLSDHSAVYNTSDGRFYFAHPIGSGTNFRICTRSILDGSLGGYVDLDFGGMSRYYAGIAARPSADGMRVFRANGTGHIAEYRDYDWNFSPVAGWVSMTLGANNEIPGPDATWVVYRSGDYAAFGTNVSTDSGVFLIDEDGVFVSEVGDFAAGGLPFYAGQSSSYILQGAPSGSGEYALYRMLSNGTIA